MSIRIDTQKFGEAAASGTGCTTVSAGVIGGSCSRSYTLTLYSALHFTMNKRDLEPRRDRESQRFSKNRELKTKSQ